MQLLETLEQLPSVVFDILERHELLAHIKLTYFILERTLTELHDCVLDDAVLLVNRVEEVKKLHNVLRALTQSEDLVLA